MRTIFRIARLELSSLFFSPIGWLALVVFLLQGGTTFFSWFNYVAITQESGGHLTGLTAESFVNPLHGLFPALERNLFLYVPLLTMGLFARETGSGSIKLLLSSPVPIRQIVLGKYLAMLMVAGLLLLIEGLFALIGGLSIGHADIPLLLSGLLGLFLLTATYAAIGLFMSALTSYQVVAAITTLAALALLNFIRELGQNWEPVRPLTYFLALSGRVDHLIAGLIASRDILYFLLFTGLFLLLTAFRLKSDRSSLNLRKRALSYTGVPVMFFLIIWAVSQNSMTAWFDVTAGQSQTLTPVSRNILSQLHSPVTVTTYANVLDYDSYHAESPGRNADLDFWERYERFLPDLRLRYVFYYDRPADTYELAANPGKTLRQLAARWAEARDMNMNTILTPQQIRSRIDLSADDHRSERVLSMNGRCASLHWIRDPDTEPYEDQTDAAFKQLLVPAQRLAFLSGNEERSINKTGDDDYYTSVRDITFRGSLVNKGFDFDDLPLKSDHIPGNYTAIVIAAPKKPFSTSQLQALQSYLQRGGNALIFGDPGTQKNLNPLLSELGLEFLPGVLVQKSKNNGPEHVEAFLTPAGPAALPGLEAATGNSLKLIMEGAVGLHSISDAGYRLNTLAQTDPANTWTVPLDQLPDSAQLAGTKIPSNAPPVPVAIALRRRVAGREQKIIVCGDADILSNKNFPVPFSADGALVLASAKWFSGGLFPVEPGRPAPEDNALALSHRQVRLLNILMVWICPLLLALTAALLLFIRNRR